LGPGFVVVVSAGMPRDAKEGFGLGDRERDFLENLSLSDPKSERVGVVGDMVMDLRLCGCGLERTRGNWLVLAELQKSMEG
jgi:hypothetical protein